MCERVCVRTVCVGGGWAGKRVTNIGMDGSKCIAAVAAAAAAGAKGPSIVDLQAQCQSDEGGFVVGRPISHAVEVSLYYCILLLCVPIVSIS